MKMKTSHLAPDRTIACHLKTHPAPDSGLPQSQNPAGSASQKICDKMGWSRFNEDFLTELTKLSKWSASWGNGRAHLDTARDLDERRLGLATAAVC